MNLTSIHEAVGSIPDFSQGVKNQHRCELWCRLPAWLSVAVAVV